MNLVFLGPAKYGMDPKIFKEKLEQFALLKQITAAKSAGIREPEEATTVFRNSEEIEIDIDANPTINWRIDKLKPVTQVCSDCHLVVEDRVIHIKLYDSPEVHWRRCCTNCNLVQNPYNQKYELPIKNSHYVNACWVNGKPEPTIEDIEQEKKPVLRPVLKKPAK